LPGQVSSCNLHDVVSDLIAITTAACKSEKKSRFSHVGLSESGLLKDPMPLNDERQKKLNDHWGYTIFQYVSYNVIQ